MTLREAVQQALSTGRPERAWDAVAEALREGGVPDRVEARKLLPWLAGRLPWAAWTEARRRLAAQQGLRPAQREDRVGVLAFPAVEPLGAGDPTDPHGVAGRVVEVQVRVLPGAADEGPRAAALRGALDAARALLGQRPGFQVHVDDEGWSGRSAELAVALAAVSAARGVPLSPALLATGALERAGGVLPVDALEQKLRLRHAARPRAQLLTPVADAPQHPAVLPVGTLAEAWARVAGCAPQDLSAAVAEARDADRRGDWILAAQRAEALVELPDLEDGERTELLALLLCAANHAAEAEAQARWGQALAAHLAATDAGGVAEARALGARVVAAIDRLDPVAAAEVLALTRGSWPREAEVHLLGPAAMLAILEGDLVRALVLRERAVALAPKAEKARCLGDLAELLRRLGRLPEALDRVEEALALTRSWQSRTGYQHQTARFLHLYRARILADQQSPAAEQALELALGAPGLDPRLRARLLQAELRGDRAALDALEPELPRAVLVQALVDRSRARLGDPAAARRLEGLPGFVGLGWEAVSARLPY